MVEETEPKTVEMRKPESIFPDEEPEASSQDFTSLDALLPANAASAEKREILSAPNAVFSGRYEPAKVCGILLTLEESDLRDLREQLYTELCSAVPAVAGRQLSRRVTGNTSALAEDCWALCTGVLCVTGCADPARGQQHTEVGRSCPAASTCPTPPVFWCLIT